MSVVIISAVFLSSLRFYFSLKATRSFGPFNKIVKLNAKALSYWFLFMLLFLLIGSNFFSILLQENTACNGLYSCVRGLI